MGFLRHRDEPAGGRRFQMREKLASIGDDSWIEDDQGQRVYKVDGKALRVCDTFILKDSDGNEVAKIKEKKLRVRDTMKSSATARRWRRSTRRWWGFATASTSTSRTELT
jgi:uncharacterized protein YxjI